MKRLLIVPVFAALTGCIGVTPDAPYVGTYARHDASEDVYIGGTETSPTPGDASSVAIYYSPSQLTLQVATSWDFADVVLGVDEGWVGWSIDTNGDEFGEADVDLKFQMGSLAIRSADLRFYNGDGTTSTCPVTASVTATLASVSFDPRVCLGGTGSLRFMGAFLGSESAHPGTYTFGDDFTRDGVGADFETIAPWSPWVGPSA